MKAIKIIIVFIILFTTVGANSQNNKTIENKKIELTISKGEKKLYKTYSNFEEIQEDKAIKNLGIDINEFMTSKDGVIKINSISSPLITIYNLSVSKEFEFTRKSSDKEDIKIKIKINK
jgi:hypothetical protein